MNHESTSRELMEGFIDGTLDEGQLAKLKQLLQADPELRASFATALRLRALLRAKRNSSSHLGERVTEAIQGFSPQRHEDKIIRATIQNNQSAARPTAIPFKSSKSTQPLARAAAWLGAFFLFGKKAQAAGAAGATSATLLMTKTATTAITVSILLLGAGGLSLIHQNNRETTARVAQLQARKDALLTTTAQRPATTQTAANPSKVESGSLPMETAKEFIDRLSNLEGSYADRQILMDKLEAADLDRFKELLQEAATEERSPRVLHLVLLSALKKFPADAMTLGIQALTDSSPFHYELSLSLQDFFREWMKGDRKAADEWYFAAMASGGLVCKSIPEAGQERCMPEKMLVDVRFDSLLYPDPEAALSMAGEMAQEDLVSAISGFQHGMDKESSRNVISSILAQLPPEAQRRALEERLERTRFGSFEYASTVLNLDGVAETLRAPLLSYAVQLAYENNKLSQSEALKIIGGLPDSPERERALRTIEAK